MNHGAQRKMIWAVALAAAASAGTSSSYAQNSNSAEVKGSITDSSSALIPGATIQLKNIQTGVVTTTTSNGDGLYDIPSVELGNYTLTVHKDGFGDSVRNGLTLSVGVFGLNATLAVGAAAQEVVVTADIPLVQTEDSGQHMTFDAKAVQDAPIVGGIWYNELTQELPGVNGGGNQDASGQGIGVNGTQGYSGSFLIEGSTAQAAARCQCQRQLSFRRCDRRSERADCQLRFAVFERRGDFQRVVEEWYQSLPRFGLRIHPERCLRREKLLSNHR